MCVCVFVYPAASNGAPSTPCFLALWPIPMAHGTDTSVHAGTRRNGKKQLTAAERTAPAAHTCPGPSPSSKSTCPACCRCSPCPRPTSWAPPAGIPWAAGPWALRSRVLPLLLLAGRLSWEVLEGGRGRWRGGRRARRARGGGLSLLGAWWAVVVVLVVGGSRRIGLWSMDRERKLSSQRSAFASREMLAAATGRRLGRRLVDGWSRAVLAAAAAISSPFCVSFWLARFDWPELFSFWLTSGQL